MWLARLCVLSLALLAFPCAASAGSGEFVCTVVTKAGMTTTGELHTSPVRAFVYFDVNSGELRTQSFGSLSEGPYKFAVLARGFVDQPSCENCDLLADPPP